MKTIYRGEHNGVTVVRDERSYNLHTPNARLPGRLIPREAVKLARALLTDSMTETPESDVAATPLPLRHVRSRRMRYLRQAEGQA